MGVHGLTSYLRENKRSLSKSYELLASEVKQMSIVVDGWSFIFALHYNSGLPWVFGGEHTELSRLVALVVNSWIDVGLRVYFVFDGARPDIKFSTQVTRLTESHVHPSLLFFRTSPSSRSTPRFLNETRIIPPLIYSTFLNTLQEIQSKTEFLHILFADEEGDPFAVELAGRIGGYVVGNDSDFVVLNSEGYRGYIPLDEMVWYAPTLADEQSVDNDEDGFQAVRKPKGKRKVQNEFTTGRGLVPPATEDGLILSFTAYSPESLASHLNVPVTLLPLLGALVGNDYSRQSDTSPKNVQSIFFEKHLTVVQRIERVASTIRSVLSPTSQKRSLKQPVSNVMDLIERTVNLLLARFSSTLGSREVESIIDKIVNSTLQYAIPKYTGSTPGASGLWSTNVCPLHDPASCCILPIISRRLLEEVDELGAENEGLIAVRTAYLKAYRNGKLSPKFMDVLSTGTYWIRPFLENPDVESVGISIGRPIRLWIYSILDDMLGIPRVELETDDSMSVVSSTRDSADEVGKDDEDELVDVVESDSEEDEKSPDFLASLKGELQRLHSEDESTEPPLSVSSHHPRRQGPSVVTEYFRRGTRIVQEPLNALPLHRLLNSIDVVNADDENDTPLLLKPESFRFTVFLRILRSDIEPIRNLPGEQLLAVLAVRWVVYTLHIRSQANPSKERETERWSTFEMRCFLASLSWANPPPLSKTPMPQIENRNIQLTAQVLMAFEMIEQLSQALMLTHIIPSTTHMYSGKLFHCFLTGAIPIQESSLECSEAAYDGLAEYFRDEPAKKARKVKKDTSKNVAINPKMKTKGLYAMLGDLKA